MVAGNVIGNLNDEVEVLPIVRKFKEIFHDRIIAEIVWSGDDGPEVQSDPKVAAAFGGSATITSPDTVILGVRNSVSFIAVAGGGGGGHGRENGGPGGGPTGDRKGGNGTNTIFEFRAGSPTGTLIKAYDLAGGEGGASCAVSFSNSGPKPATVGGSVVSSDPNYGTIGTGGVARESSSGTDATGIGAGGGGGGGDLPDKYDESGNGGKGGSAGEKVETVLDLSAYSGQTIYMIITQIGSGGTGAAGGGNNGGNGVSGGIILKEETPSSLPGTGPVFNEQDLVNSIRGDNHLGLGYKIDGDKIFDVFLTEANKYTNIRKLRVLATREDGTVYDETQVAYMGPQYRTNIDPTIPSIVTDENNLDPTQLNEDENIVQYFNDLYNAWVAIRDDVILNGVIGLTSDPLPTFDINTGLFSTAPTSVSVYTANQTWSINSARNVAFVSIGGGAAGGVGSQSFGGGGGGVAIRITQVLPGETFNFNIGTGGTGGSNAAGANGGNTTITGGSLSSPVYGGGGIGGNVVQIGPNGGGASGGDYNINGGDAAAAAAGVQSSGGPAGGPNGSLTGTEVNLILSQYGTSTHLVRSNGKVLCGHGGGTGSNGGNFGGGGGASSTSSGSGSSGAVAVLFF